MSRIGFVMVAIVALVIVSGPVGAQQGPPPGYYDIPSGFDFPADKQTLEKYRTAGNVSAQRVHVWNVFAGLTQTSPDGKYPTFQSWYSEDETFANGPSAQGLAPRRLAIRFQQPNQFRATPGHAAPQAAGTALLSFVLYNYAAYNHIRSQHLYQRAELGSLMQSGQPDPKIPNDRVVPAFPVNSVSLKTIWWPVKKGEPTAMPVWDPELNPANPAGNGPATWPRVVVIDPTQPNPPPDARADISLAGKLFSNSHVVGLNAFYYMALDEQTVAAAMKDPFVAGAAQFALGRPLQAGDYVVFAGSHLTTKEIDDWVWATFWWHDRPNDGPFAADRTANVKGAWRNYLMRASYDLNLPREADGGPHVTFNPWLEAGFGDDGNGGGTVSNCMNCHNRASFPRVSFLPIYRGDPDLHADGAFASGRLRGDFLWSVPDQSK